MAAYTGFAYVYDKFMADIPYQEWAELIKTKLIENGVCPGASQIVDLGCGTGMVTLMLASAGYHMTGIDNSEDMLSAANEALCDAQDAGGKISRRLDVVYSLQDMADFKIPYMADGIVSVCDSMNYITDEKALPKCFKASWNALRSGGVMIFDMKKEEFYREVLADNTYAECLDDCAYIWNNFYNEESHINEYDLTVFMLGSAGMYERYDEYHVQRAYNSDDVVKMLSDAGFIGISTFEHEIGGGNEERMYFIAVKP